MNVESFQCLKCKRQECEVGQLRAAGGFWSKMFNIQNMKFKTYSCTTCGYTDIYKEMTKTSENILDFFIGG